MRRRTTRRKRTVTIVMSGLCVAVAIGAGLYALSVVSSHVKPVAQAEPLESTPEPAPARQATSGQSFDLLQALDAAPAASISVDSDQFSNLLNQAGGSESGADVDTSAVLKLSTFSGSNPSR